MARYILGRLISLDIRTVRRLVDRVLADARGAGRTVRYRERRLPEATRQAQLHKYGLDKPISEQYVRYIWTVLHGDFGVPFQSPTETVARPDRAGLAGHDQDRHPDDHHLALPWARSSASSPRSARTRWVDYVVTTVATLGLTVPSFVVATWLILILQHALGWLPTGGWGEPKNYIMPVIAYSLAPMALVARYTRVCLLEVMHADHVRTARAKGLREQRVLPGTSPATR